MEVTVNASPIDMEKYEQVRHRTFSLITAHDFNTDIQLYSLYPIPSLFVYTYVKQNIRERFKELTDTPLPS